MRLWRHGGATLGGLEGEPRRLGEAARTQPLAHLLKPFRITTNTTIRVGDRTLKGYYRHQFEEVWERYPASNGAEGPSEEKHGNKADEIRTSGTFRKVTPDTGVTDRKCEKPVQQRACYRVTPQKGGNGLAGANRAASTAAEASLADPAEPIPIVPEPPLRGRTATDITISTNSPADDASIPAFLQRCVQCNQPSDASGAVTEREVCEVRLRLHPQCHRYLAGHPDVAQETIARVLL